MTRRRAEALCLAGLGVFGLYSLVLLPVAPSLVGSHPVLLEALRGSIAAMVSAGAFARVGQASLVLALLAPIPTLMLADPLMWWAGRIWGRDAVDRLTGGGGGRWTERGMRWSDRYGAWLIVLSYFLPIPSFVVFAAAGWSGMRLRRFLVLDLAGTVLWVLTNVGLGYLIGRPAVHVAKAIGHYGLYVSIALAVIVFVMISRRTRAAAQAEDASV